jgi:hypothetical protein
MMMEQSRLNLIVYLTEIYCNMLRDLDRKRARSLLVVGNIAERVTVTLSLQVEFNNNEGEKGTCK